MVLHHFGIDDYDEMQLAKQMEADDTNGISVEKVRDFFIQCGFNVEAYAGTDYYFADEVALAQYCIEKIDSNIPIIVDWEDWGGGDIGRL